MSVQTPNSNQKATTKKSLFSRETEVRISIDAKPSIVWAILTNASDFARWNSTIIAMNGTIEQGQKITLKSVLDLEREFKLKVELMEPEKKMVWADGQAPFFRGVRTYTLEASDGNTCVFTMNERLAGIMAPLVLRMIPDFDESFDQFAIDLKNEAETAQKAAALLSTLKK